MNESGIYVVGNKVLVKPDPVEEVTKGGIVLVDQTRERDEIAGATGVVLSVGESCWEDYDSDWAAEGDRVLYAKHAGHLLKGKDEAKYRVLFDTDIIAKVDEGVKA